MKRLSWIFPVLMLLVAGENLFWDHFYGNFALVCYPVMGLLILLNALLALRLRKTGKRRLLILMILVLVLYLLIAVFRTNLQQVYYNMMQDLSLPGDNGCWTTPVQQDWQ